MSGTPIGGNTVVGVCGLNDLDFEQVFFLHELCPTSDEDDFDDEVAYYANAQWAKRPDGLWEAPNATLVIKVNFDVATAQVLKSPCVEKHGKASPCYPLQADLGSEGYISCYALPLSYRAKA